MDDQTAIFISKARATHGELYDYSESVYVNSTTKIAINCPHHGMFYQLPTPHIRGRGCRQCGIDSKRSTKDSFVEKASRVHSEKYSYENVNYINNTTKVLITCPEHGSFEQTPGSHLLGNGCPKCKGQKNTQRNTLTTQDFITRAREVHGTKYGYDDVVYTRHDNPITIICPAHGKFEQTPNTHT